MFWRYNANSVSQVDTALDKENVTLTELLELEDIIQECKNQNKKLIEYLTCGDILSNLIDLIIHEPPEDTEPSQRFKLANVAAELLSCEVPQINEKISKEEHLLERLYSFLETTEAPLNPLLASFFTKAFGVLITRKSDQNWYSFQVTCVNVIEFLKKKEFVSHVTKHISTSAISDFVIKLITGVEGNSTKQGLLDWLNEKELIESIISLINDRYDQDVHDNASRLIIEIFKASRNGQHMPGPERCVDQLLIKLESPGTVELLLNNMFSSTSEEKHVPSQSVLVNGISILLTLIENRKAVILDKPVPEDTQNSIFSVTNYQAGGGETSNNNSGLSADEIAEQQMMLDLTIATIVPRIEDFTSLLQNPPCKEPIKTTAGVLDPPLGHARLQIARLIGVLLSTNNLDCNKKLIELKTLDILLDLFFQYSLNNFLHAQVEFCIKNVFNCSAQATLPPQTFDSLMGEEKKDDTPEEKGVDQSEEKNDELKEDSKVEESQAPPESMDTTPSEVTESEPNSSTVENETGQDEVKPEEVSSLPDTGNSPKPVNLTNIQELIDIESIHPMLVHLYNDCHLVDRVLGAWEANENEEAEPGQKRKGYMAHLTKIANVMQLNHENQINSPSASLLLRQQDSTRKRWTQFVDVKLAETNERNIIIPPQSYHTNNQSSSDDDDADFRDINFPQEPGITQMFQDYQSQQMSDNISDTFGYTDDDFNDNDDTGGPRALRFGLDDSPGTKQSQRDTFEAFCNSRFACLPGDFEGDEKSSDDQDDDDDPWEGKTREIEFGACVSSDLSPIKLSPSKKDTSIRDASSPSGCDRASSSSDEEENSFKVKEGENAMEVEEADDFFTEDVPTDIAPVDANIGNPWGSTAPTEVATPELAKTPIKEAAGSWAAFGEAPAGDESSWAAFNDCEMKSVKPTEEDQTLETLEPKCEPGDSLPNATSEGLEMATEEAN